MQKKAIIRFWLSRLGKYLLIPTALCAILLPLYNIYHTQAVKAQLSDASEQLSMAAGGLEDTLYDIRYVTNKLFHDSAVGLLAASTDEDMLADAVSLHSACTLLDDLTYSLSGVSYSYVTFAKSSLVVDNCRFYRSYDSFYPTVLQYPQLEQAQWRELLKNRSMNCVPAQEIRLYQTAYPDTFLTVSQPFFDSGGRYVGQCSMLLREKQLVRKFLPYEKWYNSCLFYLEAGDGTVLARHNFDGAPPREGLDTGLPQDYQGQSYLLVSRQVSELGRAVIGIPYELCAESLAAGNRLIWLYILTGLLGCIVLSIGMTVWDMRGVKPMLAELGALEPGDRKLLSDIILKKLRDHDRLSIEIERLRNQLDHGYVEALLRRGLPDAHQDRAALEKLLRPGRNNYLLLIPQKACPANMQAEYFLMLAQEQMSACFGFSPYLHVTADGTVMALLPLEASGEELCRQAAQLHHRLDLNQGLILSPRFSGLEQLSNVYWQTRNAMALADPAQSVVCLTERTGPAAPLPQVTTLELLNEYLISGCTEKAQGLIRQVFQAEGLSLPVFRQSFYSIRGVLLAAAQTLDCEDISHLCVYSSGEPVQVQVESLCECCLVICAHVDAMKQSHNRRLQQGILDYLEQSYRNPELNLAMVADHFSISRKYVSQFLKDQTGKSYNEYVEDLRLSHAMELLRGSGMSITDVAAECGFASQNTFYKAFRRRYDISPSQVRRDRGEG